MTSEKSGVPPIAAISLRFTANAFQPTSLPGSAIRQEVDVLDHRVGRRDQVLATNTPDGGVVAGADDEVRRAFGADDAGQALDQAELAEL